ncbi:MAG: MARVEL-like domain-containing protein [Clostridia bacterium]|nr:MARVEL-like domain-containing protein [Clostridia bacterium]
MAGLFNNKQNTKLMTERGALEAKYNNSISNLLLVVGFSLVNIILLVTNADTYFLFSAFIPYFAVDYGMYFCGMYPEEYYYDVPDMVFEDKSLLVVTAAIAAVSLLVYLLCWYLAKKKKIGAVIFALIIFIIDTVVMLWLTGFSMDSIFDIVIHVWVISYLVIAIVTYFKMKKLPDEEAETVIEEAETAIEEAETEILSENSSDN